jgi:hypothetical protein
MSIKKTAISFSCNLFFLGEPKDGVTMLIFVVGIISIEAI